MCWPRATSQCYSSEKTRVCLATQAESLVPGKVVITLDPRRALVMVRPDISRDQGRQPAGPEQAKIINTHVAFHAHKFIIRRTGTNPLHEIVVPKRAHPIIRVGDLIGMAADASEAARDKMVALMSSRAGRIPRRRK